MTEEFLIKKSTNPEKKWMLVTSSGKRIHFGASGMDDYLRTGDNDQKDRYIKRHLKE